MADSPTLSNDEDLSDGDDHRTRDDFAHGRMDKPETPEWMDQTQRLVSDSQQAKLRSESLREEVLALRSALAKQIQESTRTVNEHLKRKITDTIALRNKLDNHLQVLTTDGEALQRLRQVALKQLTAREGPLQLAERRMRMRMTRPQRDPGFDEVERALQQEHRDLQDSVEQLSMAVEQIDAQLHDVELLQAQLQSAIEDKDTAAQLDQDCLDLVMAPEKPLRLAGSIPKLESTAPPVRSAGTLDLWKKETDRLSDDSIKMEQVIVRLKRNLKATLRRLREQNTQSKVASETALRNKIGPGALGSKMHSVLMQQLHEVNEALDQVERAKSQMHAWLHSKEKPLGLVQRRLAIRQQRPQREAVRDPVEQALEEELSSITSSMDSIQSKLDTLEREQKRLMDVKNKLTDDLAAKAQGLQLDKDCMDLMNDTPQRHQPTHSSAATAASRGGPWRAAMSEVDHTPYRSTGSTSSPRTLRARMAGKQF